MVDGRRLRFRLVGINNQNFIMGDEETGTWWQQVTGRAILGPLRGRQLQPIPHDEVNFDTWTADHPNGRVLAQVDEVDARDEYVGADWERDMKRVRTVTTLPKGSPLDPRALVVGISIGGRSRAWPLDALRASRVQLDVLNGVPLMIVLGDDGRSVRVFDRRVAGRETEFAYLPGRTPLTVVDLDTATEWDFAGAATAGERRGTRLQRIPFLLEYWFDWQTYHPATELHKPWNPIKPVADRLEIPRPDQLAGTRR